MRVINSCPCGRRHRNAWYFARCRWPGAEISGRGQLAIVIDCPPPRVVLVERLRWAHTIRSEYGVFGCGPDCARRHDLVAIDHDGEVAGATK